MSGINIADGLGLLIGIVAIATVADRLRVPYPILLVVAGLAVALLPVHHRVELEPELILLVFLPPLIYAASLDTSAGELRTHWRTIALLAVGLVLATMCAVAVVFHTMIGGTAWAVAFAVGAIVSPPDSVAATQLAGKLGLPRRLVTVLGGEGLMNDATALTAYATAVAAVGTHFTAGEIFGRFAYAVVVGTAMGLAVGWMGTWVLRVIDTPVIENTILLILPFAAYLPADKIDASGVLAVVATGLYFGRFGSRSLSPAARLQQREIWELVVFLLTGLSFLLVGLELRPILDHLVNRESRSLTLESLAVVGTVVGVRLLWMFLVMLPTGRRFVGTSRGVAHNWRETTIVGWAGMRGAVSLAAALALPQTFPQRDLIVFLTFAVIVATLVGQGASLPLLIRRLGLVSRGEQDELLAAEARRRLTVVALAEIDEADRTRRFPDEVVERIRLGYESQLARIEHRLAAFGRAGAAGGASSDENDPGPGSEGDGRADPAALLVAERELRRRVIGAERTELDELVNRRKVPNRIAEWVRATLDVEETTLRP
ncbi:MAG TPA: Na+/H+ antiporter [Acidimicrobiales bacterium]|nr:Na+/H+ antiporter [Acidimicrobiales bacterium]